MTTDTRPRRPRGRADGWSVGGMAKGAGMLAPGLATMLCVLTTDAVADSSTLDERSAARHRASRSTGSTRTAAMSTNDTVLLLASGASGCRPTDEELTEAVTAACHDLAQQLLADAEGSTKDIAIEVRGAVDEDDAVEVAARGRPQQPGQDRAVRGRPQLGPDPGRGRHHAGRVRARRAGA